MKDMTSEMSDEKPELSTRNKMTLIKEARAWLRQKLDYHDLELDEFADLIAKYNYDYWHGGLCPTAEEIGRFLDRSPQDMPFWLKVAVLIFDHSECQKLQDHRGVAYRAERAWYHNNHPFDMSRPWILRDEYQIIAHMASMSPLQRRAMYNFVLNWNTPYAGNRHEVHKAFLTAFAMTPESAVPNDAALAALPEDELIAIWEGAEDPEHPTALERAVLWEMERRDVDF